MSSISEDLVELTNDLSDILRDCNQQLTAKYITNAETLSELPDKISHIGLVDHFIAGNLRIEEHYSYSPSPIYEDYPTWQYSSGDMTDTLTLVAKQDNREVILEEDHIVSTSVTNTDNYCGLFKSNTALTIRSGYKLIMTFVCTITDSQYYTDDLPCRFALDTNGDYTNPEQKDFTLKYDFSKSPTIVITSSTITAGAYYIYIQTGGLGFTIDSITYELIEIAS